MDKIALETDVKNGLSSYQLAKKYEMGGTTVRYWLKKFGLKTLHLQVGKGPTTPRQIHYAKYGSIHEKLNWEKCQEMNDGGMTWRDLVKSGYSGTALLWAIKNGKIKLRSLGNSLKLAHKLGKVDYTSYRTSEFRKKQSRFGGLKPNSGRCKHIKYTMRNGSVGDLQGTWELKFAVFLDDHKIEWERNRVGYKYIFMGKPRLYFPDFWIKELDTYVEVKGYETERDREKWKQFPFKLLIVKKQEIQDLESWWKLQNNASVV